MLFDKLKSEDPELPRIKILFSSVVKIFADVSMAEPPMDIDH